MRKTVKTGAALMAVSAMIVSAQARAADDASAASETDVQAQAPAAVPPAPQGPFFSRGMADNMGFPPMGFDPMSPTGGQVPPALPPGAAHAMNNNSGAGLGGGNEVDIQIRGRIKLNGQGAGNQAMRGNNVWQSMPYGMPYNHGYGAPYGTPFNQGFGMPQAPVNAPSQTQAPVAEGESSEQAPAPQVGTQPFSWAPQQGMSSPGGFIAQPQMPAAPQAQPQLQAAPTQPPQPTEPDWVKQQRAEAEKRQKEAQERFAQMQKNNPYAQQPAGQSVWSGPQNMNRGYGMPFQHGYGAPYGAPFMGQPYGYAQPQAPAQTGGAQQ